MKAINTLILKKDDFESVRHILVCEVLAFSHIKQPV